MEPHSFVTDENVAEITLPPELKSIGKKAFYGCAIKEIRLPDGLEHIGREAFKCCESLEEVTIPDGITELEKGVFYGCISLKNVRLPEGLRLIGPLAFAGCSALTGIAFPDGLEEIGRGAFTGFRADRAVIPESVKKIDLGSFCKVGLVELLGNPDHMYFHSCSMAAFPVPVVAPNTPISSLPDDLKPNFLDGFFREPYRYDGQVRDDYIAYIVDNNTSLLPEVMRQDNAAILSIYDKEGLITADNYESVYLPAAQSADAAQCISWLLDWSAANVSFDDLLLTFEAELSKDPFSEEEIKKLWKWEKLPDGSLCLTCYTGTASRVTVPGHIGENPVTALGTALFCPYRAGLDKERSVYFRDSFVSVNIPNGITAIGDVAFSGCSSLCEATLPDGLLSIGMRAFAWCKNLRLNDLPESVEHIGKDAFTGTPYEKKLP